MCILERCLKLFALCLCFLTISVWSRPLLVEYQGVSGAPLKNIKARVDATSDNIPEQIQQALAPFGWFKVSVKRRVLSPKKHIVYIIHKGPRMRLRQVRVSVQGPGRNNRIFSNYLADLPIKSGDTLDVTQYEKLKQSLFSIAEHRGFVHAKLIKSELKIDRQAYFATIHLVFNTGRQYKIGHVSFSSTPLSEKFLRRYIPFHYNDIYDTSLILTLHDRLSQTGYFKNVIVTPDLKHTEHGTIPIHIQLKMRKRQHYTVGVGAGTDTGVRGSLGWNWNYTNQYGHQFKTTVQGSQVQSNIQAKYIIPGANPTHQQTVLSGSLYQLNLPNTNSKAGQLSASFITHKKLWKRTIALNALYEQYTINNLPTRDSFILYPSFDWKKTVTDDLVNTQNGYSLNILLQGSIKSMLSSTSFAQGRIEGRYLKTLGYRNQIKLKAAIGALGIKTLNDLPPSLQFFTGGSQTLRGFSYQELGPGRIMVLGSAELRHEVSENWKIAGFADVGNVNNHGVKELKKSIGAGLIRKTPIGPIRVYLAKPIGRRNSGLRFVFSMGPEL